MIAMLYTPEVEGMPFLAVLLQDGQVVDATPFERRIDAEAYLEVCEAGMASDLRRSSGAVHA